MVAGEFPDESREKNVIPSGYSVPATGYLLVWADGKPGRNSSSHPDLHVNFKLNRGGEAIALFAPDGRLVDSVIFGPQTSDISEGRYPSGVLIFIRSARHPGADNLFVPPQPSFSPLNGGDGGFAHVHHHAWLYLSLRLLRRTEWRHLAAAHRTPPSHAKHRDRRGFIDRPPATILSHRRGAVELTGAGWGQPSPRSPPWFTCGR